MIGINSIARNTDANGDLRFEAETPDSDLQAQVDLQLAAEPAVMPYFFMVSFVSHLTARSSTLAKFTCS